MACPLLNVELNNILLNMDQIGMKMVSWNMKRTSRIASLNLIWAPRPETSMAAMAPESSPTQTVSTASQTSKSSFLKKKKSASRLRRDRNRMRDFLLKKQNFNANFSPINQNLPAPHQNEAVKTPQNEAVNQTPDVTPPVDQRLHEAPNQESTPQSAISNSVSPHSSGDTTASESLPSDITYGTPSPETTGLSNQSSDNLYNHTYPLVGPRDTSLYGKLDDEEMYAVMSRSADNLELIGINSAFLLENQKTDRSEEDDDESQCDISSSREN